MDILLSIIIPAYNAAEFLSVTLTMLIEQGLENCEVIVINDGSVDATESICRDFSTRYSEIRFVSQENQGVSVARNRGMNLARGKYIYFLDSDDMLTEGSLTFFKSIIQKYANVRFFSFGYIMQRNGTLVKSYISSAFDDMLLTPRILQESFFSKKLSCNICSCIYDRSFLENYNIVFTKGVKIGEDVEFIIKAINQTDSFYYSKRICFVYQLRDNSAMQGYKIYTPDRMKSFEIIRNAVLSTRVSDNRLSPLLNFFIANLYVSNLVAYLLSSGDKNSDIETFFLLNKKYIYYSVKGRILNLIAIYLVRCIPLKLLFKIFKSF
ncbi:glycosyltransferase family 2 protein [Treponema vincentii]|uniref:glycosyltransferase family 2 protein n=1 Tax=Treponema vincentii TaxID=69710 RepID=UPI003D9416A2